jgi:hypothetical protein
MGLLDDAIRDHLELKRRRGADPAEVERAEREALGPVRRNPEDRADVGLRDDAVPVEDADHVVTEDDPKRDGPIAPAPADDSRWIVEESLEKHGPEPQPPVQASAEAAPRPSAPGGLGEDTVEHHVELDAPGPTEADEDVLEETPEFLQDAPDHDRLWFEQKPPRDFDFDG